MRKLLFILILLVSSAYGQGLRIVKYSSTKHMDTLDLFVKHSNLSIIANEDNTEMSFESEGRTVVNQFYCAFFVGGGKFNADKTEWVCNMKHQTHKKRRTVFHLDQMSVTRVE